jgi:transcriptional regulator with XRE-family HTH domain
LRFSGILFLEKGGEIVDMLSVREIFPRKLLHYMALNNKTRNDLVRDLGFKYSTIRDWEKGLTIPRMDKVQMLATYFNCKNSDLIEDKKEKPTADNDGLSKEKQELIEHIKNLPEDKIQLLLQVAKSIG